MDPFEQALKFIQAGRLDEARIYFEELLKQDPENENILYNLGMLYTELGSPNSAVPLLKKCIEILPGNANAHVALGFVYMSLGDLKAYVLDSLLGLVLEHLQGAYHVENDIHAGSAGLKGLKRDLTQPLSR